MDINILLSQMTQLFIIMLLGYIIYKCKIVDDNFTKKFSSLILTVTMPLMVLSSILQLEERQALSDVIVAFVISTLLFFIVLPVVGLFLAKVFRVNPRQEGLYTFMNTYSNVGFMGFPVIGAILGNVGLFYAAIYNLMFNLSVYTLGIALVNKGRENKEKFSLKRLLTPGVILSVLAIFIYFLDIKLPSIITNTIASVGSITSPSAMLIIGCTLAKMNLKSVFSDWRLYPWTFIKQLVIPLLLWIPYTLVIKNDLLLNVTYILTAMPVANSAVLFANEYDGDSELAARAVFITTLCSLITVPLCILVVS